MSTTTSTTTQRPTPRRATRATSEAVRQVSERRSLRAPLVIKGISPGKLVTITPSMFGKLDVDPGYQRGKTTMVGKIVRALQAGGLVLDPVTLCIRKGDKNGTLWIVDGFQRTCAHQQLNLPFQAMVHESEDMEAERHFFLALNERRNVSANVTVKAWNGPVGELLRKAEEDFQHPLYRRINFAQCSNEARIAAASLVRALFSVIGIDSGAGNTSYILARLDTAMKDRLERARIEHFLRLAGKVWAKGSPKLIVLRSLASVARERWFEEVDLPSPRVIERLQAKNWAADVPLVEKYRTVLLEQIRKIWKAAA